MAVTLFGSIGSFIKKSMSAGSTAASALDYSMKGLETQAFLMNAKGQASALSDANTLNLLQNYVLSEEDSENIKQFVLTAKLMKQQVQTTNVSTNTLIRR